MGRRPEQVQQLADDLFGRRAVAASVARSFVSVLGHPPTSPSPRYAQGPFLSPRYAGGEDAMSDLSRSAKPRRQ